MASERNTDASANSSSFIGRIALIGNFLPRRCGIATYTTDVYQALRDRFPEIAVDVYVMNDRGERHSYPPAVVGQIEQDEPASYLEAARAIEASGADVVWLQHEYGIFGGDAGDHILKLLDRVTIPVVVALHTVLEKPSADQRRVLDAIIQRASRIIVMADRGRALLERVYGAPPQQIAVIPHGIPDRPLVAPDVMKPRFGLAGHRVVLTFGLLSPGKGVENMIEAMPAIVERFPDALYLVLGATHPHLVAHEGEAYRDRLETLAERLGVSGNIRWVNRFVETEELLDYLVAADVYVTPYLNPEQVTSGTLAYAVGLGKPVVSTPYLHAAELLADGHGVLVPFGDTPALAEAVIALFEDDDHREDLRRRTYALGRTLIWPRLAERSLGVLADARAVHPASIARVSEFAIPAEAAFSAVERLSDSTGMLQHSIFSVPDRNHGYCVDDNARALILMSRLTALDDARHDRWWPVFASFVQGAWNPATARFRNFMAFDRRWLEDAGSEDSCGRTLWALGVTARDGRHAEGRAWASALFDQVAGHALQLGAPRARAFAMLAAAAMLEAHPGHMLSRQILEGFGESLLQLLANARRPDWTWFEPVLAYDNCRLPEALLRAGHALGEAEFVDRGLESLRWIVGQQTTPTGQFRAVGSESFGRAFQAPLPFDQQPLEGWATIDACAFAWSVTGDARWRDEAERGYRWFLGDNDLATRLASPDDGECFDGLNPVGVNRNRGAESVLAFQLATVTINRLLNASADGHTLRIAAQ